MAQIQSGILLMVVGMGSVLIFLCIMVGVMQLLSYINAGFDRFITHENTSSKMLPPPAATIDMMDDPVLLAVITAAIQKYRAEHES